MEERVRKNKQERTKRRKTYAHGSLKKLRVRLNLLHQSVDIKVLNIGGILDVQALDQLRQRIVTAHHHTHVTRGFRSVGLKKHNKKDKTSQKMKEKERKNQGQAYVGAHTHFTGTSFGLVLVSTGLTLPEKEELEESSNERKKERERTAQGPEVCLPSLEESALATETAELSTIDRVDKAALSSETTLELKETREEATNKHPQSKIRESKKTPNEPA
jgi:hypothetical protein